ncbi:N-acetyltransferase B complex non catalytic subunit-domain-containing protein [Dipodascopsis tothii]|uniref:N-acetyltransferase B complex non catalytic subunit-domain-containing protein n=1 Tax=Dipodascopsis tothii TaxID=44089 RepID=UPI0034CDBA9F
MSSYQTSAIWQAIQLRRHPQALQLVQKALRRNPQDPYMLTMKAHVLGLLGKHDESAAALRDVVEAVPTDINTLELAFGVLVDALDTERARKLYEAAVRKRPRDEDLADGFYMAMCVTADVRGMQQAGMLLQKAFPKREYVLKAVEGCYLLAKATAAGNERTLFATLATRLLARVAPLATAEEAVLDAHVRALVGDRTTAAEADTWNNLELTNAKLDALVAAADWPAAAALASRVLFDEGRDDYTFWRALVDAAGAGAGASELPGRLAAHAHERNGSLAAVYAAAAAGGDVAAAAAAHFALLSTKPCAYDDLIGFVAALDPAAWLATVDAAAEAAVAGGARDRAAVVVSARRFRYALAPTDEAYVATNIRLYNELLPCLAGKAATDYYVGDDLLVLAAAWLLERRPGAAAGWADTVAACIYLLEVAAARDSHQYRVRLWLVRLYSVLGCAERALGHYDTLAIKNVQVDTLAHYAFTRAATTRPAWQPLIKTRDIYSDNAVQTPRMIRAAFDHDAYSQVEGMIEFGRRLTTSVGRGLLLVESRRTARFLRQSMDGLAINPRVAECEWTDNRDRALLDVPGTTPAAVAAAEVATRVGPLQTGAWVRLFAAKEAVVELLTQPTRLPPAVATLAAALAAARDAGTATAAELAGVELVLLLARSAGRPNDSDTLAKTAAALAAASAAATAAAQAEPTLTWAYFHDRLELVEAAKLVLAHTAWLGTPAAAAGGPPLKAATVGAANSLRRKATALLAEIRDKAGAARGKTTADMAARVRAIAGVAALDAGAATLERVVEGIAASHDDGLVAVRNAAM